MWRPLPAILLMGVVLALGLGGRPATVTADDPVPPEPVSMDEASDAMPPAMQEFEASVGDLIASGQMKVTECAAAAYDPETEKLWTRVGADCDTLFDDRAVLATCSTAGWTCSVNPVFSLISGWNYYNVGGVTSGCSPSGEYYRHIITSSLYYGPAYPPTNLVSRWTDTCEGWGVNYCSSVQSTYLTGPAWWKIYNNHSINMGGYGKSCPTQMYRYVSP